MNVNIEPYLMRLNDVFDPERSSKSVERQKNVCLFRKSDRLPVAFVLDEVPGWERIRLDEAYACPELMLLNELRPIYGSALVGDDRANTIRANFGVGILPSLFGCEIKLTYDAMPWVEPLNNREAIAKIVSAGAPDLRGGLWARIEEFQEFAIAQLADFPALRSGIRLSMCDMQGPFSIAHLVWGNDIYYAVVDDPDLVRDFLELVTDVYIRFVRQEREATKADDEFTEFLNVLVPGKILIREDSATNLSPAMYEEFCLPYIQKTLDAFPGGVHYCGAGHQFFELVAGCRNLTAMNFGNPEMQRPERVRSLAARGIAVVGWGLWPLDHPLDELETGISLGISVHDVDEGKRIMEQVASRG
ncbi:MAG TPA: uroporphyrinogen decarboxylase family protein [Candidatus Latescibacteria bacterium]|nr:uroporphyrinogen decarboxylase family protein [Candidatus Latescibacterota bacterium]